jgi:hypothetical protein
VTLVPKQGHEGAFHVRMAWGDSVVLPPETDGGAVELDEIAVTFLSALTAETNVAQVATDATASALDALLGRGA